MQALLGIDLGTTGVKAALFATEDGQVISSAFIDYPLAHPYPGWAEQDPEQWWQATITAHSFLPYSRRRTWNYAGRHTWCWTLRSDAWCCFAR